MTTHELEPRCANARRSHTQLLLQHACTLAPTLTRRGLAPLLCMRNKRTHSQRLSHLPAGQYLQVSSFGPYNPLQHLKQLNVQDATTRRRREETYAAIQNTRQIGRDWWSVSQETADATTFITHSLPHAADTSPAGMR